MMQFIQSKGLIFCIRYEIQETSRLHTRFHVPEYRHIGYTTRICDQLSSLCNPTQLILDFFIVDH